MYIYMEFCVSVWLQVSRKSWKLRTMLIWSVDTYSSWCSLSSVTIVALLSWYGGVPSSEGSEVFICFQADKQR